MIIRGARSFFSQSFDVTTALSLIFRALWISHALRCIYVVGVDLSRIIASIRCGNSLRQVSSFAQRANSSNIYCTSSTIPTVRAWISQGIAFEPIKTLSLSSSSHGYIPAPFKLSRDRIAKLPEIVLQSRNETAYIIRSWKICVLLLEKVPVKIFIVQHSFEHETRHVSVM